MPSGFFCSSVVLVTIFKSIVLEDGRIQEKNIRSHPKTWEAGDGDVVSVKDQQVEVAC